MNVLHISAECYPFAKVGGLADVVGSLPGELKRLRNVDARVILPKYKSISDKYKSKMVSLLEFTINLGDKKNIYVGIETLTLENVIFYFVDNLFYFGSRDQIYNYGDESERFAYFQVAALEAVSKLDFIPDIIHVHDWHTAMIPLLIKTTYKKSIPARTVLTIHNLAYQGIFPLQDYKMLPLKYDYRFEFEGFLNFLKAGIVSADLITTVSETYANEILTDYYGYGMQRLLRARRSSLLGILNGISYKDFNPETDKLIKSNYDFLHYREGKLHNKSELSRILDLDFPEDKPLIGIISRLVSQKGIDLLRRVLDEMLKIDDFYLVVLGDGEPEYVDYFQELETKFNQRVRVYIGYDNNLAHLIYSAADMFLMPSKFEPCGLGQLIALRYGTIPIVRETGGLADTVVPFNEYVPLGNGFSFKHFNAHDMMHVIRYAIDMYRLPEAWDFLVGEAMTSDFSWTRSAKIYKKAYRKVLNPKEEE